MVLVSSRGYILNIWARFGGNGKCNDGNIWRGIIQEAKEELKKDPNAKNILTFFDEQLDAILTDRGFRDAEETILTLISPKSKGKGKKQQTANDADFSRFVTKIRNVVERINKVALKKWLLLGGKPLDWRYFNKLEDLVKIASALFNCYHGPLDPQRTEWDESDLKVMLKVCTYDIRGIKFQKIMAVHHMVK